MKLEVGMFVRTKYNGIGKIVEYINDPTHYFFKCYKLDRDCSNCEEYITKADVIEEPSHNIIDLIEVGDYVNGFRVVYINHKYEYLEVSDEEYIINKEDIKSIVTKEQFECMKYSLEG